MHQPIVTEQYPEPVQAAPMADDQAVYRMIGLARRAGRVIGGMDAVDKAIRQRQAHLIIIAADAAERTSQQIGQAAVPGRVSISVFGEKHLLGHWTGSNSRAALAIVDPHFAARIETLIQQASLK